MKASKKIIAVLLLIGIALSFASCGESGTGESSEYISLLTRNINFDTIDQQRKIEYVHTAGINPEEIVYTSSDETVAVCDGPLVTSVGFGVCSITLKDADDKLLATCKVNVNDAQLIIKLSVKEYEFFEIGETFKIDASNYDGYSVHSIVEWTTSARDVATVKDGVVTAKGYGTCTITAYNSKSRAYANCIIKVTNPSEPDLTLSLPDGENTVMLDAVGDEFTLTATPFPSAISKVTWQSSDESVATVNDGKIVATGKGRCVIIAKCDNGKNAACLVNVGNTPERNEIPEDLLNFDMHNLGETVQVRNKSTGEITAEFIVISYELEQTLENNVLYIVPKYTCVKVYDIDGEDGRKYIDAEFNLYSERDTHCESRTYRVYEKSVGETFVIGGRKFGINIKQNEPRSFYMTISLLID